MIIDHLLVRGCLPFPQEVAFHIPEGEVIQFAGQNGSGKSTLLDLPYIALFGERTKPISVYELFNTKDGKIGLLFQYKGHQYEIVRLIDGVSRKQQAFFYKDTICLNEGKVKDFDNYVLKEIGISKETYLAAFYNAQTGKGNPLSLDDEGRRRLLCDVLNLQEYERLHEHAVKEYKDQEQAIRETISSRAEFQKNMPNLSELSSERDRYGFELGEAGLAREAILQSIEKANQNVYNAKANAQNLNDLLKDNDTDSTEKTKLEADKRDKEKRIQENKGQLLDRADLIRKAVSDLMEVETRLNQIKTDRQVIEAEKQQLHASWEILVTERQSLVDGIKQEKFPLDKKGHESMAALNNTQNTINTCESEIKSFSSSIGLLDDVACKGNAELQNTCVLLKDAQNYKRIVEDAKAKIVELSPIKEQFIKDVEAANLEYEIFTTKLNLAESDLANILKSNPALGHAADQLQALAQDEQKLQAALPTIKKLADLAPHLDTAEEKIKFYEGALLEIDARLEMLRARISERQAKINDAKDLQATQEKAEHAVKELNEGLANIDIVIDDFKTKLAEIASKIKQCIEFETIINELQDRLTIQEKRYKILEELKNALGPKGIRQLKIDAAGPQLEQLINDLLNECIDSKFSVRIQTRRQLQNEEWRECLQFTIVDNSTGLESSVDAKSGGEQALIQEAIGIGLAILKKLNSEIDAKTLIRDETSAALDQEHAVKYIKMLKEAAKIGGFQQILFVSHMPNMDQFGDAIVKVEGGKVHVI